MDLLETFCDIDDFCKQFEPEWKQHLLESSEIKRDRKTMLCLSEVMTIIIAFHSSGYRTFKHYYTQYVAKHLLRDFPNLVSYNRFVELMRSSLIPLCYYLQTRKGKVSGIAFIDSTPIAVCHNRRIYSHKVFSHIAKRGKSSVDWFYGFKLHLIINDVGELLAFRLTLANVDDRAPVPKMTRGIIGKLFGDKGYISQKLFTLLFENGLQLITKIKMKMKNRLMPIIDKILLRKRALIETVNDQLKNISQVEHSRHRSVANFFVNIVAALIAYTYQDKKPSLNIRIKDLKQLPAVIF